MPVEQGARNRVAEVIGHQRHHERRQPLGQSRQIDEWPKRQDDSSADGKLEAREHGHPSHAAVQHRRDEVAAGRNADQNHCEHDSEPVDGRPQKQRENPEPDDLERQRYDARYGEDGEDDPQTAPGQDRRLS